MFLLDTLLLLSPLAIYAFVRVWQQITSRLGKWIWAFAFVLGAFGYPLAETLSHSNAGGWAKPLMIAGYCTLPFGLYLVLSVLATDLVTGVLWPITVLPAQRAKTPRFKSFRLALWFLLPALIVTFGLINHQRLQLREYTVEIPRRSSAIEELRIVFVSDIHLNAITADDLLERMVSKINSARPDIVLVGGDVVEGDRPDEDMSGYEAQFRRIQARYGVYGAPGNHDRRAAERNRFFQEAGIRLLHDEVELVGHAFYVAGRKDARSAGRLAIEELVKGAGEDLPVILVAHRPVDFDAVSRAKVDVQLSGHTHHGQVWPANLVTEYQNELSWGHLKKHETHFFVSSGVQLWGPPVRTSGVAEIMVINVAFR